MNDQSAPTIVRLPAHSVTLILSSDRRGGDAAAAILADRIPARATPWDVNAPDASIAALHEALADTSSARVVMKRSHPKARAVVASIARKRGAIPIVLRLPGAPDFDAKAEGYEAVHDVADPEAVEIGIVPMPSDRRDLTGPFDIIGDVHGCAQELKLLLVRLGHAVDGADGFVPVPHPDGRLVVLVGDLTDRGPANRETVAIARTLVDRFGALLTLGNHDDKLMRWLGGRKVRVAAGLAGTIAEFEPVPVEERLELAAWLAARETHYVLDGGHLVVAHAGLTEVHHGRHSGGARSFALYGAVTGGVDANGNPEADDWALEYAGDAVVVHGHVVHPEPRTLNRVVAIDTGCVFGGSLTAYRWPEREFVSVPALKEHFVPRGRDVAAA